MMTFKMLKKPHYRANSVQRNSPDLYEDYPLQGTSLDVPITQVLRLSDEGRSKYIHDLLNALHFYIESDLMALKNRVSFKKEIADYRALLRMPADSYSSLSRCRRCNLQDWALLRLSKATCNSKALASRIKQEDRNSKNRDPQTSRVSSQDENCAMGVHQATL